jgi:colicin import membrane protein
VNKQYDAAVASLSAALTLNPTDDTALQALKQAEKGQGAKATDAKSQAELKQKTDTYQKLLAEGRLALNSKRYDDAIKAFSGAQDLLPGDQASKTFLTEAQKAKKDAADAFEGIAAQRAAELKRAADVKQALSQGRLALASHNLEAASKAFDKASQLDAKSAEVQQALRDLDTARKAAAADAQDRLKKREQYQALIEAGNKAYAAQRYADAVKSFGGATAILPEDKTGQELLKKAQGQLRVAEQGATQATKVQALVKTGQAALKARDLVAAGKALTEAGQLDPQNAAVREAWRDLDQARKDQAAGEKLQASFQAAVQRGEKAFKANDFTGAVKAYTEATQLIPGDAKVKQALQQSQVALADARRLEEADLQKKKKAQEEQDRRLAVAGLLKQAGSAFTLKRYPDAKKLYEDALKLNPSDLEAQRGLRDVQKAVDDARKTPIPKQTGKDPEPKDKTVKETKAGGDIKAQFQQQMQEAAGLEKQRKYSEAMNSYQAALKLMPDDAQAKAGLRNAEFSWRVSEGQRFLDAMRYTDATREFEAALKLSPNNAAVQKLLAKAKAGKK